MALTLDLPKRWRRRGVIKRTSTMVCPFVIDPHYRGSYRTDLDKTSDLYCAPSPQGSMRLCVNYSSSCLSAIS
eukprot:33005-Eustigmatos_ZCMA.PRE.1